MIRWLYYSNFFSTKNSDNFLLNLIDYHKRTVRIEFYQQHILKTNNKKNNESLDWNIVILQAWF